MLVGVVEAVVEDLGLGFVRGDVVTDLGRPQLAPLVALPDREAADDIGMGGGDGGDLRRHLRVGVVGGPAGREVGRGPGGRDAGENCEDQRAGEGGERAAV